MLISGLKGLKVGGARKQFWHGQEISTITLNQLVQWKGRAGKKSVKSTPRLQQMTLLLGQQDMPLLRVQRKQLLNSIFSSTTLPKLHLAT